MKTTTRTKDTLSGGTRCAWADRGRGCAEDAASGSRFCTEHTRAVLASNAAEVRAARRE